MLIALCILGWLIAVAAVAVAALIGSSGYFKGFDDGRIAGSKDEHPSVAATLAHEPDIGSTDESKCLPGWITSFCRKFEEGQGWALSHNAIIALCHTLIAARERSKRLVRERDEARSALARRDSA
jgi:hypothetical protein